MAALQPTAGLYCDILAEAWRPGAAEPIAVHVTPGMLTRMRGGSPSADGGAGAGLLVRGLPLVADERVPDAPGYEVHRAPPARPPRPTGRPQR
jgi:hypothetical protein